MTFVRSMQTKVSSSAETKLNADRICPGLIIPENILSKIASEAMKTTIGSRKARTTFFTIEGPSALPNCSYAFPQSCL